MIGKNLRDQVLKKLGKAEFAKWLSQLGREERKAVYEELSYVDEHDRRLTLKYFPKEFLKEYFSTTSDGETLYVMIEKYRSLLAGFSLVAERLRAEKEFLELFKSADREKLLLSCRDERIALTVGIFSALALSKGEIYAFHKKLEKLFPTSAKFFLGIARQIRSDL